jgi:NADPH-dependent 2,4-dienoyl-CoA reductase/sulfur reductase-like enzyme
LSTRKNGPRYKYRGLCTWSSSVAAAPSAVAFRARRPGHSAFAIAREALRGHKGWPEQWSSPEPRAEYDVVIVGAGGHGLATAYYLAKEHGITNVAVLEKGWLGGGNTGRNTTIIRSNYLYDEIARSTITR